MQQNIFLIWKISLKSMLNRRLSTCLAIISVALSVTLLLGIERIRYGVQNGFESTISGTDLIVGARSGPIQLLLYSVFHIGTPTNNISWKSYQNISQHPEVKWSVPISLGDSHKGYRVIGTKKNFFQYYKYGRKQALSFQQGTNFIAPHQAVLGYEVAKALNYNLSSSIILSHGTGKISFQNHEQQPFSVVGILKQTGTPVDRSILVSLQSIEAIHVGWEDGAPPLPGQETTRINEKLLEPKQITTFFLGLQSKIGIFHLQREINSFEDEALTSILPGAVLQQLWQSLSFIETTLVSISFLVFITSLFSLLLALMSTLNERRREMSILRSLGVRPPIIFALLVTESTILSLGGILLGGLVTYLVLSISSPFLEASLGLHISLHQLTFLDVFYISTILVCAVITSLLPAWTAYKNSIADGLTIKI